MHEETEIHARAIASIEEDEKKIIKKRQKGKLAEEMAIITAKAKKLDRMKK